MMYRISDATVFVWISSFEHPRPMTNRDVRWKKTSPSSDDAAIRFDFDPMYSESTTKTKRSLVFRIALLFSSSVMRPQKRFCRPDSACTISRFEPQSSRLSRDCWSTLVRVTTTEVSRLVISAFGSGKFTENDANKETASTCNPIISDLRSSATRETSRKSDGLLMRLSRMSLLALRASNKAKASCSRDGFSVINLLQWLALFDGSSNLSSASSRWMMSGASDFFTFTLRANMPHFSLESK
mmetsp:Transcript_15425/g.35292  ORF Transcript_15425/g.35292 Transcript_15425/m.35292 type:complete len:241 (-) Transcript_15425:1218-1940(-)